MAAHRRRSAIARSFVLALPLSGCSGAPVTDVPVVQPPPERAAIPASDGGKATADMAHIPAGKFQMGSNDGREDEAPVHAVTVQAFEMDTTEVTVAAYGACVKAGTCTAPGTGRRCNWSRSDRQDHPINCVDWVQARTYCRWAGKRLPTEEEWEYAARGTDSRKWPWGDQEPADQLCWNRGATNEGTCPVGSHRAGASPFGVLDMAGNVSEWMANAYCPYPTNSCTDRRRVIRGGCWGHDVGWASWVRAAPRLDMDATYRSDANGFRCARGGDTTDELPVEGKGVMGTATIQGVVSFTGKAPEMKVPKRRKDADLCKTKRVKDNVVIVHGGKLQDVFVRIANDGMKGVYEAPSKHVEIDQIDCMYAPRIQGAVVGQTIDIRNGDRTLHNEHTYRGPTLGPWGAVETTETWFNKASPKGSPSIEQELPDMPKVVKLTCDVHPWERGFVVVTAHPFFAVSGADGSFIIEKVPAGEYTVEAWHAHYGLKTARVKVEESKSAEVSFSYDGTEKEPDENKDELVDLF